MTPKAARQAWYREMAEKMSPGPLTPEPIITWHVSPDLAARLAAHFGRLALGRVQLVDVDSQLEVAKKQGDELRAMGLWVYEAPHD